MPPTHHLQGLPRHFQPLDSGDDRHGHRAVRLADRSLARVPGLVGIGIEPDAQALQTQAGAAPYLGIMLANTTGKYQGVQTA